MQMSTFDLICFKLEDFIDQSPLSSLSTDLNLSTLVSSLIEGDQLN